MELQKKIYLLFIVLLTATIVNAQEKPASPAAVANGKINGADITISYSSPSVKGRKIWGELVPFNEVWRAGANEATTFETDKDLTVEGLKLPAGKYSFFVIPNEKECVIIFNKQAKQWGAYKYNEKEDQIRVTVKQQIADSSTESLVYKINENGIFLIWEKCIIPISIK
ncbi:DUF2911 domain-containing protein [Flavobacterium soyangense]|uniref:DUF2911 domain-containing protein n=1 Tax=Flavobacterium soyangense TaxID=2023265 RepID=A0A930UAI8_9FLAO|nr:DUF2911 domain-containing protein [Flavobacterium soyangense]MBF2709978.1 DUF2911 domain-containing protein [Flavobacterium soyangense]